MEFSPKLIDVAVPERPVGVVLVLHGGASRRRNMRVSPTQLSVLRMIPIAQRVAQVARGRLAVFRLLNSVRGWDTHHTPVLDVRWALRQLTDRLDERLPACLVGHSLGGRAAILAADRPEVRSVAALAPWVYPTDVPSGVNGRRIMIVHGSEDRVASPDRAAAVARGLGRQTEVAYVNVLGGKHAMLGRHNLFDGLAAQFAVSTLLGEPAEGTIARVLAGERWIEV